MSEYTHYNLVKENLKTTQKELSEQKILSVVDNPEAGPWTIVTLPFNSEENEILAKYFDVYFTYFEDEDFESWSIKISFKGKMLEKKFYKGENFNFTPEEKEVFEKVFELPFEKMERTLKPGKSEAFFELVGAPYFNMLNQEILLSSDSEKEFLKEKGYCILFDELD